MADKRIPFEGLRLTCDHPGCKAGHFVPWTGTREVTRLILHHEARNKGWTTNLDTGAATCPEHRGER